MERSREKEEKSKKVIESLTSALHKVSSEAREAKERVLSNQADQHEHYKTQLEDFEVGIESNRGKVRNHARRSKGET